MALVVGEFVDRNGESAQERVDEIVLLKHVHGDSGWLGVGPKTSEER
jgi:hypothetical protein